MLVDIHKARWPGIQLYHLALKMNSSTHKLDHPIFSLDHKVNGGNRLPVKGTSCLRREPVPPEATSCLGREPVLSGCNRFPPQRNGLTKATGSLQRGKMGNLSLSLYEKGFSLGIMMMLWVEDLHSTTFRKRHMIIPYYWWLCLSSSSCNSTHIELILAHCERWWDAQLMELLTLGLVYLYIPHRNI